MARNSRSTRPASKSVTVDFTGVESGARLVPEGDYRVEVASIEQKEGKEYPYFSWKFKIPEGEEHAGATMYYNTSLNPNSLWNLRQLLEALGVEVPSGPLEIDFDELTGLDMIAVTQHDTYDGKKRSQIVDFYSSDSDDDQPAAEESKKGDKKADKKSPKLEKLDGDEVGEMSEDELEGVVEKYELDIDLAEFKTLRKKQNAVIDALEEKGMIA